MPLTNPTNAIKHLYPDISRDQYKFRDRSDEIGEDEQGNPIVWDGVYLEYLDPALGTPPTQAELEQAEIDYQPPSKLTNGTREPTVAEITANLQSGYFYYIEKVQAKVKKVAFNNGIVSISRDANGNQLVEGSMEKAAKAAQLTGRQSTARYRDLLSWEQDVWEYLTSEWALIDPNGDFTGGGATPVDWATLEAQIDANHPAP